MSSPIATEILLQQLRWRYAVKKFDPARRIPPETWSALEQALVLTPSSYGLQPWKFVVITDPATKAKLQPLSYHQSQVVDCSHYVVFCIKKPLRTEDIEAHVANTAAIRGVPRESLQRLRDVMVRDLIEGTRSWRINDWAANQIYIALGNFMTAAALLGVDTCPMEGFEPAKYDQALGLAPRGLAATVCCSAGYRLAEDKYAAVPKIRFPLGQVVERLPPA
jgi:nitroreductase